MPADSWPRCCSAKQPEVREPRDVAVGGVDAEHAAHQRTCPISTKPFKPSRETSPGLAARITAPRSGAAGKSISAERPLHIAASASATSRPSSDDVVREREQRRSPPEELDRARASTARSILAAPREQHDVAVAPPAGTTRTSGNEADAADDRRRRDRAAVASRCRARRFRRRPGSGAPPPPGPSLRSPRRAPTRSRGFSGIAEVEAVGQPDRLAAGAGDVARRLEHRERARRRGARLRPAAARRARRRARAATAAGAGTAASSPGRRTVREPTRWS